MSNITRAERLAAMLHAELHVEASAENGAVKYSTAMLCSDELRRLAESERSLVEALKAVTDAAEDVSTFDSTICLNVHHAKKDQHQACEPCPVAARHRQAYSNARALIATTKEARNG